VVILGATGCAAKKIALSYRFPAGYQATYRWSISAVTSKESPQETGATRLEAVLEMQERVAPGPADAMTLTVLLKPLSVKENGQQSPKPPPSKVNYAIAPNGRILRVLTADLAPGAISSLELDALASETRPPLAAQPVALGETWNAPLRLKSDRSNIAFSGNGKLLGFDLIDKRRLARVETVRHGPVTSVQILNKVPVTLKGISKSHAVSTVDVDRGALFSSDYRSISNFDVLLASGPVARLRVMLTSRLQLIDGSRAKGLRLLG